MSGVDPNADLFASIEDIFTEAEEAAEEAPPSPLVTTAEGIRLDLPAELLTVLAALAMDYEALIKAPGPIDSRIGVLFPVLYPEDAEAEAVYRRDALPGLLEVRQAKAALAVRLLSGHEIDEVLVLDTLLAMNDLRLVFAAALTGEQRIVPGDELGDETSPSLAIFSLIGGVQQLLLTHLGVEGI